MALEEEDEGGGIPEWVVTFGDMMSLLLTFFIMLVSLSEVKQEEQYQAMIDSIRKQFGHDATMASLAPGESRPRNSLLDKLASMGRAKRYDTMRGGNRVKAPIGDHPRVRIVRPGSRTAVGTVIAFTEGESVLGEQQKEQLRAQAGEMRGKPQKIEIRGHTARRPLGSDDTDVWDLAFARCRVTVQFLEQEGIRRDRMRLSVAGPYEPFYIGTKVELMKQNPRVEVFLLDEQSTDLQGSPDQRKSRYRVPLRIEAAD